MGLRVINTVEKNIVPEPVKPVVVPPNTPTQILASIIGDFEEYAARYIQNIGQGICYYNFTAGTNPGTQAGPNPPVGIAPTQLCGILGGAPVVDANGFGAGQQLDVSNFCGDIWAYSTTGTTIAVTVLLRKDLIKGGNPL